MESADGERRWGAQMRRNVDADDHDHLRGGDLGLWSLNYAYSRVSGLLKSIVHSSCTMHYATSGIQSAMQFTVFLQ